MSVTEGAPAHGAVAHLLPQTYKRLVSEWLEEDTPSFDYGGFVVGEEISEARLLGKSEVRTSFQPITHCATVRGPVRNLLLGERVALNTLARCSGIATKSHRLLQLLRKAGYPNILAGTRKTTPGFRLVEKYGMLVGGVDAHRVDLSAMTMLKDNHIVAAGSITNAVRAAKSAGGFAIKVEVECQSFEEADEAIAAGADIVMLDNFTPEGVKVAASQLKEKWGRGTGDRKAFLVEVSGGLTEENVEPYVCADIDIVSTSSIHQGVKHVDFSLKIVPKGKEGKKEGGESLEMSFHCNTDRLLEVYHENFWPAYPFTVPNNYLQKRRSKTNHGMDTLLLVQQWVGSIYAPWTPSEPYYNMASYALTSPALPIDPWTVQALIIMSFAQYYSDKQSEAHKNSDKAIAMAIQLQMNSKAFARVYGEGDAVLEESWRRTYLFVEFLDQNLSVVSNTPFLKLRDTPNLVDLPCEDEDFISGQIPPPPTWNEYDMREFADVEVIYSSLVYLLDITKTVSFSLGLFIKFGRLHDEYVNLIDAKVAAWQSLLPSCKRDPLRQDGTVDEVMFMAHETVAILSATVHRPYSSLTYSMEELSTRSFISGIPPTDPSEIHRNAHTARTLKAIDIQTKLLSIPCAIEKHNVVLVTVVARIALAQISACNVLLDDYGLTIARDRVRLSIGFLTNLGMFWPLAAKVAKDVKYVSKMTLSSLPSTVTQQSTIAEIEIPRDELLWPINPATQIDIYAGLSLPMDWPASMMGYTSSSTSSGGQSFDAQP
ncbi:nicotinate-nucleotide diphosphorylase [Periconia macrospinosa]|uniref:Nicotinate-nucleotide pyrophosphorylase [carboxylating] n=1 Tax=Periconia macrospinosa TaxID=97972 RepID=A0A2V1DYK7_9PLEO|nr:nicotinate-nucleotide diphosphorylase [Periconia macrospinosa]